jgi:hypothetical protein
MTARKSFEEVQESRWMAGINRDIAQAEKNGKREDKALELIGTLCREGKTIYYVNCYPLHKGKIRESSNKWDLVEFLIRNGYVR